MSDLSATIRTVETALAEVERGLGNYADDPNGYHRRMAAAMKQLARNLGQQVGATVTDRFDGARVRIAGIASTSTSGLNGAFHNWLTAARKRENAHG